MHRPRTGTTSHRNTEHGDSATQWACPAQVARDSSLGGVSESGLMRGSSLTLIRYELLCPRPALPSVSTFSRYSRFLHGSPRHYILQRPALSAQSEDYVQCLRLTWANTHLDCGKYSASFASCRRSPVSAARCHQAAVEDASIYT